MTQNETLIGRSAAGIVALAPLVLLVGFVLHPWIGAGPPDQAAVAAAATDSSARWGIAHVAIGVGSGLLAVAFLALHARLRAAGDGGWSERGLPLVVLGSAIYALLPGMEMAPFAAAHAHVDVEPVAEALVPFFIPVHVLGGLLFAAGIFAFRKAIAASRILGPTSCRLVLGALAAMAVARLVPLSLVNFYVQSVVGILALWPLAFVMHKASLPHAPGAPQPTAAG